MAAKRGVRSFVRRTGRITPAQRQALERLWTRYGVDFSPAPADFDRIFGRCAPRVMEIGFGDGESLVTQAANQQNTDFTGVEVHRPGVGHCLMRAEASDVDNLRVICHDAVEVLQHQVSAESFTRINLYFPDPWPKKRHHKRRLVQPSFLDLVARRLIPGGRFHVATDWPGYAEHIDEVLGAHASFALHTRREHRGDAPLERPRTRFERRGLTLGHTIVDWRFDRV